MSPPSATSPRTRLYPVSDRQMDLWAPHSTHGATQPDLDSVILADIRVDKDKADRRVDIRVDKLVDIQVDKDKADNNNYNKRE